MKYKIFIAMVLGFLLGNVAWAGIDEGIEYKRVSPPQPTSTKKKIEVTELFWYGCPHCYHFEPDLNKWLKTKPDNVVFNRIPAVFNASWSLHARAFYAAEMLGILYQKKGDKHSFHEAFFDAIHKERKKMNNRQSIQKFFAGFGVSQEDFNNTFDSFLINTKVGRAATLSKRYQLDGVPTMIINGKYRTDGPMAGGRKGILKVMNYLIDLESKK